MINLKIFQIDAVANSGISGPEMVDYTHIGLFRKQTETKGALMKSEFFRTFENNVYSDLIVEEVYDYIESAPLYLGKITAVNWYNTDETVGFSNSFTYMFLPNEIINFGMDKRSNVLAIAKLYAFQVLGSDAFVLLDYCVNQISSYIQGNTNPLILRVNSAVDFTPGMTQPIADNINGILTNL